MTVDQPISIQPNTSTGKARIRVIFKNAWRHLSDPNAKNILDGVAYDINLNVLDHDPSIPDLPTASYAIPSGTMHPQGNAYLTRVYTSDAIADIDHTWDNTPASVYTLLEDGLTVYPGSDFTLHLWPTTSATPAAYARTYAITMPSYIPTGTQTQNLNRTHAMAKISLNPTQLPTTVLS